MKQACKLRVCENMKPANPSRRKKRAKNVEVEASTKVEEEVSTKVEEEETVESAPSSTSTKVDEVESAAAVQV